MNFFKSNYFRLTLISTVFTLSLLAVIPRIPIKVDSRFVRLDSTIGGYFIQLGSFNLDLRSFKKGLDLGGGQELVLHVGGYEEASELPASDAEVLESVRSKVEERLDFLDIPRPYRVVVDSAGSNVLIQLPSVLTEADLSLIATVAGHNSGLQFKSLKPDVEWSNEKFEEYYLDSSVWDSSELTDKDMVDFIIMPGSAAPVPVPESTESQAPPQMPPSIQLQLSGEGKIKFSELAKNNVGKPLALFLEGNDFPLAMPVISDEFAQGMIGDPIISGDFNTEIANALSIGLKTGNYSAPVEVLEQKALEADFGSDSVQRTFYAACLGFALLMLFFIANYGRFGFYSAFSLLTQGIFVLAVYKVSGFMLTLPSLAGILIGVAVTSESLIFIYSHIKREVSPDKPLNLSVRLGLGGSLESLKHAYMALGFLSLSLLYLGSGPVTVFATSLLTGLFVAYMVTHLFIPTLIQVFYFNGFRRVKS